MPSVETPIEKAGMATMSVSVESFETFENKTDHDSDEESFHLPLTDDESENNKNGENSNGSKEDILDQLESIVNKSINTDLQNGSANKSRKNEESIKKINNEDKKEANEDQDKEDALNDSEKSKEQEVNKEEKISENKMDSSSDEIKDTSKEFEENASEETAKSDKEGSDNEDLLDISVVKDTGEDDAECAQNEIKLNEEAKEAERDAKLNNDDDGSLSDKVDEEDNNENTEKSELISDDKKTDDDDEDETVEGIVTKENCTDVQIEEDSVVDDKITIEENGTEAQEANSDETVGENSTLLVHESVSSLFNESMDTMTEDCSSKKGLKRTISDEQLADTSPAKKPKTKGEEEEEKEEEEGGKEEEQDDKDKPKGTTKKNLLDLKEFMKHSELTLLDLNQFCIQKICEAIVHQSQLGDYQHQIKVYEQTIEVMRKEIVQLTKQTRDLEIVNRKLSSDLKQNGQKPLQPLKITRSVGLQVKFAATPEAAGTKRRPSTSSTTPATSPQGTPVAKVVQPASKIPRNSQNTIPPRQPNNVTTVKSKTPILSQVLSGRKILTTATTQQIHSSPQSTPKKSPSTEKCGIIDLTDEDDKNKGKAIIRAVNGTNGTTGRAQFSQGIRINSPQKITPITSVTSTTPLMYVVSQNSNMLGGTNQKAVLVNLQSSNAVLTSTALNGQVSVLTTKQANGTISQLKTTVAPQQQQKQVVSKQVKLKHPAPLPAPPAVRLPPLIKPAKPIPPKPVLTIRKTETGIILQWKMPYELELYETIASYQLYAYQETNTPPSTEMWRRVGDVKALALPMACTLTQFADRNKYYFAVRPVDIHKRIGAFSDPKEISL